tara:strand:- start:3146 stop:4309 length:1164 start_codon:yes stop_codon:yes gene_type:complete
MSWELAAFGLQAAGSLMGFLGGKKQDQYSQKLIAKQHEADIANWEYNWQEANDAHTFALEDMEIAQWNFEQTRKHRDQAALREWIDKDKLRMFEYNQKVKAYNDSVESYGVQLEYNDISNDLATAAAERAYQDKLTLMGYQFEDIKIGSERTERDIGVKRREIGIQLDEGKKGLKLDRKKLESNLKAQQAELNAKLELQRIQGFDFEGKVRALGQAGRSAKRNVVAARQASQRLDYAIMDAMDRTEQTAGLDLQGINDKLKSFGDKMDLESEKIINELWNTRVDVEYNEAQLRDQLKSQNLAFEAAEQRRKLDKYAQDLSARESIAPAPILAPQVAKPLELPEPKLQKPRKPRKGPRPIKGAAVTGHGLAGLAGGLQSMASIAASLK